MQASEKKDSSSVTVHGHVIESLARETGTEPEFVKELFEREMAQLRANAKVTGFLSVLACRQVRLALRAGQPDPA